MSRSCAAILGSAMLALAVGQPAAAANKIVEASRLFRYYDGYLKLPAAERSRFVLAYYLHVGPGPLTAPVWLLDGDTRVALPLRADGKALRLPTLAQLDHDKVEIGLDEAMKFTVTIGAEPLVAPSTDMDARELAAAIAQASVGQRKIGGIAAMALPKLQEVAFVGAPSGEVEFLDGHKAPLPMVKGSPTYNPGALPNAKRIRLAKPPLKLDIN